MSGEPEKRMGIESVKESFNAVAKPAGFQADTALLNYARDPTGQDPGEWQVLTFSGNRADGTRFEYESERIVGGFDLRVAAKAAAHGLIAREAAAPQLHQPEKAPDGPPSDSTERADEPKPAGRRAVRGRIDRPRKPRKRSKRRSRR